MELIEDISFAIGFLFAHPLIGLFALVVLMVPLNLLLMVVGGIFSEKLPDKCMHFHEKVLVTGFWVLLGINIVWGVLTGEISLGGRT